MACVNVYCPRCDSALVYRHSQNPKGQSCFLCRECCSVFQLTYTYQARKPGVKGLIVDMAFNGAGIRDTARTLKVGINTCLDTNDFIRRYDLVIDELLDATDLVDAGSETDERRYPPKPWLAFPTGACWSALATWQSAISTHGLAMSLCRAGQTMTSQRICWVSLPKT